MFDHPLGATIPPGGIRDKGSTSLEDAPTQVCRPERVCLGCVKWSNVAGDDAGQVLMSHTGHRLSRAVAFQFTLGPTRAQVQDFFRCAGAARFTFNHHIASVKANLTCRAHQRAMGMPVEAMTPSLSWSVQSRINEFNAWKNGRHELSPTNDDGTRGLAWRTEVPADVFECASVDAARALGNYSASATGARAGVRVGFPRLKARAKTAPSFRLRSKSKPGGTAPVRFIDAKHLRLGKLGSVRVHGSTRRVRRMHTAGRFHIHSVTVTLNGGRWMASVAGVAAELHHQHRRRTHASRPKPHRYVGADFGIKSLVVAADSDGNEVRVWEGVNALHSTREEPIVTHTPTAVGPGRWVGTGTRSSPRWGVRTATDHHRHSVGGEGEPVCPNGTHAVSGFTRLPHVTL